MGNPIRGAGPTTHSTGDVKQQRKHNRRRQRIRSHRGDDESGMQAILLQVDREDCKAIKPFRGEGVHK